MELVDQVRNRQNTQRKVESAIVYCHPDDFSLVYSHPEVVALRAELGDVVRVQEGHPPRDLFAVHVTMEKLPESQVSDLSVLWRSLVPRDAWCDDVNRSHEFPADTVDGEVRCMLRRGHVRDDDESSAHRCCGVAWFTGGTPASGRPTVAS